MDDAEMRAHLEELPPEPRDRLRRVLTRDILERGEFSRALIARQDPTTDLLADLIDTATLHPEGRRQVVRLLAEIDAG